MATSADQIFDTLNDGASTEAQIDEAFSTLARTITAELGGQSAVVTPERLATLLRLQAAFGNHTRIQMHCCRAFANVAEHSSIRSQQILIDTAPAIVRSAEGAVQACWQDPAALGQVFRVFVNYSSIRGVLAPDDLVDTATRAMKEHVSHAWCVDMADWAVGAFASREYEVGEVHRRLGRPVKPEIIDALLLDRPYLRSGGGVGTAHGLVAAVGKLVHSQSLLSTLLPRLLQRAATDDGSGATAAQVALQLADVSSFGKWDMFNDEDNAPVAVRGGFAPLAAIMRRAAETAGSAAELPAATADAYIRALALFARGNGRFGTDTSKYACPMNARTTEKRMQFAEERKAAVVAGGGLDFILQVLRCWEPSADGAAARLVLVLDALAKLVEKSAPTAAAILAAGAPAAVLAAWLAHISSAPVLAAALRFLAALQQPLAAEANAALLAAGFMDAACAAVASVCNGGSTSAAGEESIQSLLTLAVAVALSGASEAEGGEVAALAPLLQACAGRPHCARGSIRSHRQRDARHQPCVECCASRCTARLSACGQGDGCGGSPAAVAGAARWRPSYARDGHSVQQRAASPVCGRGDCGAAACRRCGAGAAGAAALGGARARAHAR